MIYETIALEHGWDLAIMTLNRPEKRNAISSRMIDELMTALDELESSETRVVILTGVGKAFCAGMDLEELRATALRSSVPNQPPSEGVLDVAVRVLKGDVTDAEKATVTGGPANHVLEDSRRIAALFRRVYDFPKPLIAAVNGAAIAGGCGLATLCDVTLAVPEARFGYTEVRIGFIPALVSAFLIRQVGEKRARDLLLSGRIIGAEEARQLGLVNEVAAHEELLGRAREIAARFLEASPSSIAQMKRLMRGFGQNELDRDLESALEYNARIRSTEDFHEGLSAFLEKRKPVWKRE